MRKPIFDVVRESMHMWTDTLVEKSSEGMLRVTQGWPPRAEVDEAAQNIIIALDAAGYKIVPK